MQPKIYFYRIEEKLLKMKIAGVLSKINKLRDLIIYQFSKKIWVTLFIYIHPHRVLERVHFSLDPAPPFLLQPVVIN